MLIVRQILKLIELLHKESGEKQLAAGFVLGMLMGFTPTGNLLWFVYVALLFLFRFNVGAALFSFGIFKIFAFALDPIFHFTGAKLLSSAALYGVWRSLYRTPIIPYTKFNNSIVLGSVLIGIILSLPAYVFFKYLIGKYREQVVRRIKDTWLWKAWKASKLYTLYEKYQQFTG